MIRFSLLLSVALLLTTAAMASSKAGQHLEPVNSPIADGLEDAVIAQSVFAQAFRPDVRIRVRTTTGGLMLSGDEMTFLREKSGSYWIVHIESPVTLGEYTRSYLRQFGAPTAFPSGKRYPSDYHKLPLHECQVQVPAMLAAKIIAGWHGVLLQTHYDEEPWRGMDGAWAKFAMRDKMQELEGRIWSPDDNSEPGMLWRLADLMSEHCKKKAAASMRKVDEQATALLKRVKLDQRK